jgi:hypothetical protein
MPEINQGSKERKSGYRGTPPPKAQRALWEELSMKLRCPDLQPSVSPRNLMSRRQALINLIPDSQGDARIDERDNNEKTEDGRPKKRDAA